MCQMTDAELDEIMLFMWSKLGNGGDRHSQICSCSGRVLRQIHSYSDHGIALVSIGVLVWDNASVLKISCTVSFVRLLSPNWQVNRVVQASRIST